MKRILTITFLVASQSAIAQNHLEPEDSVYSGRATQDDIISEYERNVVRKFGELYNGGYPIRAIVLPSFETEYAIGISHDRDSPKIVGLRAETKLWFYSILESFELGERRHTDRQGNDTTKRDEEELRASIPPSIADVTLARCELPVTSGDRSLFVNLWRKTLYDTRYPERGLIGLDGVSYHFSGDFDFQSLAGKTWSPREGSQMRHLTKIAETLYEACAENNATKLIAARQEAENLCVEIGCAR